MEIERYSRDSMRYSHHRMQSRLLALQDTRRSNVNHFGILISHYITVAKDKRRKGCIRWFASPIGETGAFAGHTMRLEFTFWRFIDLCFCGKWLKEDPQ